MENIKKNYIIGIGNSAADRGVIIQRAYGTWEEVENFLMALIEGDRMGDSESFDYGTESVEELEHCLNGSVYGYSVFGDYHIDYVAIPEEEIKIKEL